MLFCVGHQQLDGFQERSITEAAFFHGNGRLNTSRIGEDSGDEVSSEFSSNSLASVGRISASDQESKKRVFLPEYRKLLVSFVYRFCSSESGHQILVSTGRYVLVILS